MSAWQRRVAAFVVPIALVAGALTAATTIVSSETAPASAASTAGFDAGQIITDQTFYNTGTMTAASIQTFLNGEVATCTAGYTCLKGYSQKTTTKAADAYCKAYAGAATESAATIVYKVGQACGINPQVLLTTLQKEEGLVTSTRPSTSAYTIAMGFGCPDTAACATTYYGFFNQVYSAARQFQVYAKNPTYFRYRAGYTNTIQYSPVASCGTKSVYIENQATASLYNYTPYTPNAATLAAGYGSAPCGAYGNRNFYLYFTDFFGNPNGLLLSPSFEGNSVAGWTTSTGFRLADVNNSGVAQDGDYYLTTSTTVGGASMMQTVSRNSTSSEQVTASIWLRSAAGTSTGSLVVWGLGGTSESRTQAYSVGTTWTQVQVTLPFSTSHSSARIQLGESTLGSSLYVDNASLTFGAAPPKQNLLTNGGFDTGIAPWAAGNGQMNKVAYSDKRFLLDGAMFGAVNTNVSGRSLAQSVAITPVANRQYTFTMYVRSGDTVPFSGTLALWALGGKTQKAATTTFAATNPGWTKVQTTINTATTGATQLKAEIYLGTVKATLWLDEGSLSLNQAVNGSFESGISPWNRGAATVNWARYTAAGLPDGTAYLQTNSSAAGGSVYQDVAMKPLDGSTYTAAIWVKGSASAPAKGRLVLWAMGAANVPAVQSFTTTGAWTRIQVSLPVKTSDVTNFRLQIYEDSPGANMSLDSALLY